MSAAPIREELAELAVQRLDGDIADEAWRALELQHGEELARALAREAAMRDAMRALPRDGAPTRVVEAILAHAAKAPAAPSARPSGGGSARWWSGAAILAAACLVTGIVLRVDHAEQPAPLANSAPETRVARVEAQKATDENLGRSERELGLAAPAAPEDAKVAAREPQASADDVKDTKDAVAMPEQAGVRADRIGGVAFGSDHPRAAAGGRGADAEAKTKGDSEGLAKLDQGAKANDDLERLRDEASGWRATHAAAAKPAAAPPPKEVLEEAETVGVVADKSQASGRFANAAEAVKPAASAGAAPAAGDAPAEAIIAKAEPARKDEKPALMPAAAPPGGSGLKAGAQRQLAAPSPANAPAAAKQQAADAVVAERRATVPLLALLAYDDARTATMTVENRGAEPVVVRRAALTLEGIGADGAAAWTFTTGQPENDTTLAPGARGTWRAPLAGAAALTGATRLRLRVLDVVSTDAAWPPPAPPAAPAAAPAPAKP
jgi:hypothetical protein